MNFQKTEFFLQIISPLTRSARKLKFSPLVRFAHKLYFSNSSLAMPVQERSAKAPRHSVMALRPLLTGARLGILCLPRRK